VKTFFMTQLLLICVVWVFRKANKNQPVPFFSSEDVEAGFVAVSGSAISKNLLQAQLPR
jgi:hypothetical protein